MRLTLRHLEWLFWTMGAIAIVYFLQEITYYFKAGIVGDMTFYFGVGRGILNGLAPYADLFETKPPIVFFLSAFSLLFGGDGVFRLLHALFLLALPLACLRWQRRDPVLFLFAASVILFAVSRTLGFQTEGFGMPVACIGILLFASGVPRRSLWTGACVALAVLLKEPFAIAMLGGILLLQDERKDALMAAAWSVFFWIAVLAVTGTIVPYFTVYLPEIFGGRLSTGFVYVETKAVTPLLMRGLPMLRIFKEIAQPPLSSLPALPLFSLALLLAACWPKDLSRRSFAVSAAIVGCFLFSDLLFTTLQVILLVGYLPFGDSFFMWEFSKLALLFLTLGIAFYFLRRDVLRVLLPLAAMYLATFAVLMSADNLSQHYLFAMPVFFAALMRANHTWPIGLLLALQLLLPTTNQLHKDVARQLDAGQYALNVPRRGALDAIMDACGYDRYLWLLDAPIPLQGMTRHSPYQLYYGMLRATERDNEYSAGGVNSVLSKKLASDVREAKIAITKDGNLSGFSESAPECARKYLPIKGLKVLFRD